VYDVSKAVLARVIIAGLGGDTGKSLVSLGLTRVLAARPMNVSAFKKGPDFIDAAWLGAAAGSAGRNLDTFMMSEKAIVESVIRSAEISDIAVIEGNRGLFDGLDEKGSHSTAQLARLLDCPVVIVVDVTKVTRTAAAFVKGCQVMDPDVRIAGVVLNRVGTARQEAVIRKAVETETRLPVLGAIPRIKDQHLPSRHLGLVTSVEHPSAEEAIESVAAVVDQYVDVPAVVDNARSAPDLPDVELEDRQSRPVSNVKIGVLRDRAFSFYYPENLSALEDAGARLLEISPLDDNELPGIDALYAGGGFPEVYAKELSSRHGMKESLARKITEGMPVWAECGGLMYLSRALVRDGELHPMVGALPVVVEQTARPQGHGYVQSIVDRPNPFLKEGMELRGHEFHYSRLRDRYENLDTVMSVRRGKGVGGGRDGIRAGSVIATYVHLHALGTPEWADGFIAAASGDLQ